MLRTILILGRVSNLPTIWTNVIVGWLVGRELLSWEVAWLVAGVSLLYWAGMALNDAFDADWDRENAPDRPIPSGKISRMTTWVLGFVVMAAGAGLLLWKTAAHWEFVLALVVAILLYDWIHKKWQGSVLIMGACRVLVYMLAYGAARSDGFFNSVSQLIYYICAGGLIYVASLTMVARAEHKKGDGPESGWTSIARVLLLLPASYAFLVWICEGGILSLSQGLLTCGIVVSCAWIVWVRSVLAAGQIPRGVAHAIAGIALYDAAIAIVLQLEAGLICLACFLLTLLLQKFIPAT